MNKTVNQILLLGFVTLLTACGGSSGNKFRGGTNDVFDGEWATSPACADDSDTNPITMMTITESVRAGLTINGTSGSLDVTEYPTNDCSGNGINYLAALSLTYGDDVPDASSVCSNTKEVDIVVDSVTSSGVTLSTAQVEALLGDELSALQAFGLLCTSSDGTMLYFGDAENETKSGDTRTTRPTEIDDEFFLVKQAG